jgi:hypothetical protein
VQGRLGQLGEGRGPSDQGRHFVDLPRVERHHGDDLLGEHVERVARVVQLFDRAGGHAVGHHGAGDQVAPVLRKDHAARHRADLVAGPADALQAGRDRGRRLDLYDEVDRAHVDAQLEAGGGHHGRQDARLQRLFDLLALLTRDAAVVGAGHDRGRAAGLTGLGHHLGRRLGALGRRLSGPLGGQLVDASAQPLGPAAGVGEDDRGPVALDEVEHPFLDRGPDGRGVAAGAGIVGVDLGHLVEAGHVFDRDLDGDLDGLGGGRLDDLDVVRAAEEAGRLVDRTDGGRQADALGRAAEQRVQPLEGESQVGAALGGGDGVHLVDDHRLDAAQRFAGGRGEQQEQRLGSGDQDVGRGAGEQAPFIGRGVAGAHGHGDVGRGDPEAAGGLTDAGERGPQIAFDVDRQRLERADVENPAPALRIFGGALAGQLVERPQEGGQGLAGAGRGHHERVAPGADRPPRAGLSGGGRGEGRGEPLTGGRTELLQHFCHLTMLSRGYDKN